MKGRKILFEALERRDLLAVGLPYSQNFDTLPTEDWTYDSSNDGRIEIVSGRLRMDDSVDGGSSSRNKAILHANLVGQKGVRLEFDHWDLKDEDTFSDGIHLSANGTDWEKVWDAKQGSFDLDLDKLAADVGLSYTEDFRIGFWQYDNYGAPYDGREWDNIELHAPPPPPPPTAQTLPYIQDFATKPGPENGWEYASTNQGRIEVVNGRLRMDDVDGGTYALNEAILHVDLQGETNVHMTGQHWDLEDEEHSQDGIFVSAGTTWEKFDVTQGSFDVRLPAGTTMIKFSQYDNYSADKPYDGREWDNLKIEAVLPPVTQVVTLDSPYVQDFTTKPGFAEGWEYASTNQGRIEVVNGRLRMDDVDGGTYALNEAILHVDLQGSFDAYLSGFQADLEDEEHDEDGIFISSDGINWTKIFVNVGNFTALIPDGTTMIKFSQYDNYSAEKPYDGREWDDLRLELYDHTQQIDWPTEMGFYKDLFIDGGAHVSDKGTYAAKFLGLSYQTLFTESTSYQNSIMVSSSTDSNGALLYPDGQPRFRMYYMNGGSSGDHVASLGKLGKEHVQTFFANGGSYTGSCAGAFAAGSRYTRYFQLIPNTNFDKTMPWGVNVSSKFDAPEDKPFSDIMQRLGFSTTVTSIPTYGGPIYRPGLDSIVGTDIVPGLQYFGRNYSGAGVGAPQVAAYQGPNTGRMAILSGHPEYRSSGSNLGLMATVYQYAIEGARKIPDLKADLTVGDTVQMVGPTQKVGDKQYHRYTIDVPAGASAMDVSLTGLSANADVFVQCDSPANDKSYLAKGASAGVVDESVQVNVSQACSVLHVSVYGAHDVKNGAAYSLSSSVVPV